MPHCSGDGAGLPVDGGVTGGPQGPVALFPVSKQLLNTCLKPAFTDVTVNT